jgi:hypothetical protein
VRCGDDIQVSHDDDMVFHLAVASDEWRHLRPQLLLPKAAAGFRRRSGEAIKPDDQGALFAGPH